MSFTNWLKGMLTGNKTVEISTKDIENFISEADAQALAIEEFAIHSAINLIAGAISKCEFRTFESKKEVFQKEYYLWNFKPNTNQNSSQFLQELISRLLYFNECLVVEIHGELIIAENFSQTELVLAPNVFENVSRGPLTFYHPFKMNEVLYFKLNNRNVKTLLSNLCTGYAVLIKQAAEKYKKSGGKKGILEISAVERNNKSFGETYENLMQKKFKNYFDATNAVLPLFDGYKYTESPSEQQKTSTNEISNIKLLTDETVERVAQAFKIPPAILKGNIADVREATNNFLTFCIDPLCDILSEEIVSKRYGENEFLKGNYLRIDTTCIQHKDIFDIAEKADKLIAARLYNTNEIRRKLGDEEIDQPWANEYVLTRNYMTGKEMNEN